MNAARRYNLILTGTLLVLLTLLLSYSTFAQNTSPDNPDAFTIMAYQHMSSPLPDSDGDGVPDVDDQCPISDLSPTVIISKCDSEVENKLLTDGCTIKDRIEEITKSVENHGEFVSGVSHLIKELKGQGLMGKHGKSDIQRCAAHANKEKQAHTITVLIDGTGSGRITSSPDGIFCETDCSEEYVSGTQVTLNASPYSGSVFAGWSTGDCSGSGTCTLIMDADTSVSAIFNLVPSDTVNLITPYVNESDIWKINAGFSADNISPPWSMVHDGFDIYPNENLKPFQAACSGRVQKIYVFSNQVSIFIACNSTYTIEYHFEAQAPDTGQIQLDNILVAEGQDVAQGDIIGSLYSAENLADAHVHFSFQKNWIPACPVSYFDTDSRNSMLNLIHETYPDANLCYGVVGTPPPLVTPYLNEFDMWEINAGFSSEESFSPWGYGHDGIDILPQGDLKAFQASCSGTVDSVELRQAGVDSNWQVDVLIECDDYVDDPAMGGYFTPFAIDYIFKPMSNFQTDGQAQFNNIMVVEGQDVNQGDIIGYLNVVGEGAYVHFGLVQFGSSTFSALGITGIPLCPEPHFSTAAKDSILNLLHIAWPSANLCYQN